MFVKNLKQNVTQQGLGRIASLRNHMNVALMLI